MAKPRNDRNQAVVKFCLAMEDHRRTDGGRVRTAKEFVAHFFPYDEQKATDRLFVHVPNEVRGPVLAKWGIRGAKAALKDDDERVRVVVHDALVAGDVDEAIFESGIEPTILVDWIVLADWWSFWRQGRLTGGAIQKALATARELGLIDDAWFLANVQGRGGKLKGTDVLCDTLSKDQIVAWVRKLHAGGDGSPAGIVAAVGWETVLAKTAQDALLFALDQFARKAGLTVESAEPKNLKAAGGDSKGSADRVATPGAAAAAPAFADPPVSAEATTARHGQVTETPVTVKAHGDDSATAAADTQTTPLDPDDPLDGGMDVAIPDIPAVDGGDDSDEPASIPSIASVAERSVWSPLQVEESPKLTEAREAMMHTLMSSDPRAPAQGEAKREAWDESEVPAKPSSLEWPAPPTAQADGESSASDVPIALDEDDLQRASSPEALVPNPPPVPRKPGNSPPRPV